MQSHIGKMAALAYVSEELFRDYLHYMKIVQRFAELIRKPMIQEIVKGMKLEIAAQFTTVQRCYKRYLYDLSE